MWMEHPADRRDLLTTARCWARDKEQQKEGESSGRGRICPREGRTGAGETDPDVFPARVTRKSASEFTELGPASPLLIIS